MKKKETIVLLDSKQDYQVIFAERKGVTIRPSILEGTRSIGIVDSGKVTFKGW